MLRQVKKIFELEAATGILLLIATALALLISNSTISTTYFQFLSLPLPLTQFTLHHFINDALMALFFLLVGLELKEEILIGELASKSRAILPAIAACGGVIIPAVIFYFCNSNQPQNLRGFAIPTATDIAFAYGVICLFGKKIPKSLKVFLISLAILDDLIAVLMIALFYSQNLDLTYLFLAFLTLFALGFLNFTNSNKISFYLILGTILWLTVLKSGIHPTFAGVALAMLIPHQKNLSHKLIKQLAPSVNFFILPIFAFANSGVHIANFSGEVLAQPLVLGIILGLFLGKQIGVMLFSFTAIKLGFANLPHKTTWLEFYGVAILTGIGFTMSFFIGSLAFENNNANDAVKIGVLCASFLSAVFGMLVISVTQFWKK